MAGFNPAIQRINDWMGVSSPPIENEIQTGSRIVAFAQRTFIQHNVAAGASARRA